MVPGTLVGRCRAVSKGSVAVPRLRILSPRQRPAHPSSTASSLIRSRMSRKFEQDNVWCSISGSAGFGAGAGALRFDLWGTSPVAFGDFPTCAPFPSSSLGAIPEGFGAVQRLSNRGNLLHLSSPVLGFPPPWLSAPSWRPLLPLPRSL